MYDGTPANYLTYVSIHAAAHQWWFDQAGNDQAMDPWLDESLATYSELLYFEHFDPDLLATWQADRVDFFRPQGKIDTAIYDSINHDTYKQAVYFNGAYFLRDLRERMGGYAFHDFLQDYFLQGKGAIVTRDDFFRVLDEHTEADYSDLISEYFENK